MLYNVQLGVWESTVMLRVGLESHKYEVGNTTSQVSEYRCVPQLYSHPQVQCFVTGVFRRICMHELLLNSANLDFEHFEAS